MPDYLDELVQLQEGLVAATNHLAGLREDLAGVIERLTQAGGAVDGAERFGSSTEAPSAPPIVVDREATHWRKHQHRSQVVGETCFCSPETHYLYKRVMRRFEDDPALGKSEVPNTGLCGVAIEELVDSIYGAGITEPLEARLRYRRAPGEERKRIGFSLSCEREAEIEELLLALNRNRQGAIKITLSRLFEVALEDFLPRLLVEDVDQTLVARVRSACYQRRDRR